MYVLVSKWYMHYVVVCSFKRMVFFSFSPENQEDSLSFHLFTFCKYNHRECYLFIRTSSPNILIKSWLIYQNKNIKLFSLEIKKIVLIQQMSYLVFYRLMKFTVFFKMIEKKGDCDYPEWNSNQKMLVLKNNLSSQSSHLCFTEIHHLLIGSCQAMCESCSYNFAKYKMDFQPVEKILNFPAMMMDSSFSDPTVIFCDCFLFFRQIFNFLYLLLAFESFTNLRGMKKHYQPIMLPNFGRSEVSRLSEGEHRNHQQPNISLGG